MKRKVFIFATIVAAMLMPTRTWAFDFSAVAPSGQTLYYNILNDSCAEVTYFRYYSHNYWYGGTKPSGNLIIPEQVTYGNKTRQVTSIGDNAFPGCTGLTSVTIPNSVTSIAESAFYGCTGLTQVTIGTSVTSIGVSAFSGCSGLTSVTIPSSVTTIGRSAFYGCSGLTQVTTGNSVTSIGWDAFSGCTGLTSVTIPNSVTIIGGEAFRNCTGLTQVSIGNSVTSIGDYAFSGCTGLTQVTIGNSVTSIGYDAFSGCTGLTSVTIPNSVTTIHGGAFRDCTGLTQVTLGNSVDSIGGNAFDCVNLARVDYTGTIEQWCSIAFSFYYGYGRANPLELAHHLFINGNEVKNLVIPNTITKIKDKAFIGCSMTSVTISDSVTSIGREAFSHCDSLTTVTIGKSVTSMERSFEDCYRLTTVNYNAKHSSIYYTFYGSPISTLNIGDEVEYLPADFMNGKTLLTSVTIPNSVEEIGSKAFYGCTGLDTIYFNAKLCRSYSSDYNPNGGYTIYTSDVFDGCNRISTIIFGEGVKYIPPQIMHDKQRLKSVTISSTVDSIGSGAFNGCTGLTRVDYTGTLAQWCNISFLGSNPTYYAHHLFIGGSEVKDLVIPSTISQIKYGTFMGCALTSVTIPGRVTSIGDHAFIGCDSLTRVNYTGSIAQWCNISFGGSQSNPLYYAKHLFIDGNEVVNLVIPNIITSINGYAFYGCEGIVSAIIPNSVTNIGNHAFYGTQLASVTIPNSVTDIGNYAFYGTHLASVTIPRSVTNIGSNAFNTNTLASATLKSSTPPTLGSNTFKTSTLINIPCGSLAAYTSSTQWGSGFTYNEVPTNELNVVANSNERGNVEILQRPTCSSVVAIIRATPRQGHTFVQWSDGSTENPHTVYITSDTTFTAYFDNVADYYTITANSADPTMGTVSGGGSYAGGSMITLTATAYSGYRFAHWQDGSTTNPRTTIVREDATYTATFEADVPSPSPATVTVTITEIFADSLRMGITMGPGTAYYYALIAPSSVLVANNLTTDEAVVAYIRLNNLSLEPYEEDISGGMGSLTPNTEYTIVVVPYNNENEVGTIEWVNFTTLDSDGIEDAGEPAFAVSTEGGRVTVGGAEGEEVFLYALDGRLLHSGSASATTVIEVPAAGTYLLRVGSHPARKVVVIR